ncbi:hypothetical protein [Collimonas pratensis]|uniref:Glyoxalase n=1 Tax=Collimonas pratensis TaxID=279113 RepID=A0A127Q0D4_9BURK|nr:hypothetical protein [Collimonas pratensis]AMP03489.1 hypothetical protein CPter91_1104 [Collimonas pratensis]
MNDEVDITIRFGILREDITQARAFYGDLLRCPEGRSDEKLVDFNFHER